MPVIITVLLVAMLMAMLFIGALGTSDQGTRRLMLRLVLAAFLVALALTIWAFSIPSHDITNSP